MWEGGRLGEGERVLLWEGMLASSQAAPAAVQEQMVACVLAPLHAEWTSPAWQAATASTAAFTATFLPVTSRAASHASASTSQPQPAYELGARDKRWTLYHQVRKRVFSATNRRTWRVCHAVLRCPHLEARQLWAQLVHC